MTFFLFFCLPLLPYFVFFARLWSELRARHHSAGASRGRHRHPTAGSAFPLLRSPEALAALGQPGPDFSSRQILERSGLTAEWQQVQMRAPLKSNHIECAEGLLGGLVSQGVQWYFGRGGHVFLI